MEQNLKYESQFDAILKSEGSANQKAEKMVTALFDTAGINLFDGVGACADRVVNHAYQTEDIGSTAEFLKQIAKSIQNGQPYDGILAEMEQETRAAYDKRYGQGAYEAHENEEHEYMKDMESSLGMETDFGINLGVETNMGNIPIEDYREIVAAQYGFDSYAEMQEEGYSLENDLSSQPAPFASDSTHTLIIQDNSDEVVEKIELEIMLGAISNEDISKINVLHNKYPAQLSYTLLDGESVILASGAVTPDLGNKIYEIEDKVYDLQKRYSYPIVINEEALKALDRFQASEYPEAMMTIDGEVCIKTDEWKSGDDVYVLGNFVDDNNFFYAEVNGNTHFEYDYKPDRKKIEDDYIDFESMRDIDRHEGEVFSRFEGIFLSENDSDDFSDTSTTTVRVAMSESFIIWSDATINPTEFVLYNPISEKYFHVIPSKDVTAVSDTIRMAEQYMPKEQIERFDSVRLGLPDKEAQRILKGVEQMAQEVTLTVAECGEFHNMGEFYENIPTVEEAVAIWKQIPPERMNGIPAIGVNIHTPGTEAFEDVGIDILSGKRIELNMLEYIPDIKGNPQAMEVIAELVAKLPEMEIDGHMSEEFEAKVWEKRMPNLTPVEQLAVEIDRFAYDYDTALYHDSSQNMTENVSELAEDLKQRNTHDIAMWLADICDKGVEPEETKRAMELLKKLAEYKPIAKIEDSPKKEFKEITLKFGKGCLGDEFQGKDGTAYRQILVPNVDKNDSRPWQTFVVKANHVHEDKFGKGVWIKLPAEGHTTLRRSVVIGEKPDGKKEWGTEKTRVSNADLKKMVEAYKEKPKQSLKGKLVNKNAEAKQENSSKQQGKDIKEKDTKKALE